jgi:hypothetical protein
MIFFRRGLMDMTGFVDPTENDRPTNHRNFAEGETQKQIIV